jgi:carbamoyl-phosphate synthase small subunit
VAHSPGFLLLEDGTLFRGRLVGGGEPTVAEVVFTTNMTGYQEVFSDPSYRGQIVVMTAPMIGNYGVNAEDPESARPQVAGVVVRELSPDLLELAGQRRPRRLARARPRCRS